MSWKEIRQKYQEEVPSWNLDFPWEDYESWLERKYNAPTPIEEKQPEFFKIKHIPSGLFYQVGRHMGSNLSKTGKVYSKIGHAKSAYNPEKSKIFRIILSYRSPLIKILESLGYKFDTRRGYYSQVVTDTPASEWEIIKVN